MVTGTSQYVYFIETNEKQAKYDGHHIAIYIADFAVPYQKLLERGLISRVRSARMAIYRYCRSRQQ